ncbi:MAG TPA: DUF58 domain-containing protein [Anaerolineae bacterium]|nr:DUF58 domain-containing protein [Anaerolineae bacterium]
MLSSELIQKIRRIEIRTRHLVNDSFAGEYHAIFKGRGMEFDEVRAYQPGDEVRSIDWNVTARMGEPFVKRYVEERELTVMLAVDASASGLFGTAARFKRDLAAELGAVLAFSAITNNDKVGLLVFTDQVELHIPPRKGRQHVLRLIRDLLAFTPQGHGTDVAAALDSLNHTLKRRAIVFLISDFLLPSAHAQRAYERALLVTNRRHDLVAVSITDPRECDWPDVGLVALQDAETGRRLWVDSGSAAWRQAFAQRAAARRAARDAAFTRAQVDHIPVTVGQDYVEPLLAFFNARARRWRR